MADQLPEPLVPADVDLRDFGFMPLEVNRLLRSKAWLKAKRKPELGFYMVNLWVGAWHEVPAGSMPDDDDVLADVAKCDPAKWDKLREQVLHGWVRCSDGRLYHPVVAEKALEGWKAKQAQRQRTQAAREARLQRQRQGQSGQPTAPVTTPATKPVTVSVTEPATENVTGSKGQGERQGQGQGERDSREEAAASAAARDPTPASGDDPGPIPSFLDRAPDAALRHWQEVARIERWPDADFLTSTRRHRLQAILAICGGLDGWKAALEKARDAEFLRDPDGNPHRWFDLDWLLDQQKFTRLMEGRYAERHDKGNEQRSSVAALAEWGREGDS